MKLSGRPFLLTAICLASAPFAQAQTRASAKDERRGRASSTHENNAQEVDEHDVVRVTTSLVKIPLSVRDREGRYVVDLRQEDFRVYENGKERQVSHLDGVDEPISVVLLIDISCSIDVPKDTIAAALSFIEQLRPADSVLPIAFGRNIYALLTESTRDHALLRERLLALPDGKQVPCDNGTRLGDAVEFVLHHVLANGKGRGAVILLTDGKDSMLSRQGWMVRSLRDVSELGVPFYSMRLSGSSGPGFTGFPNTPDAERAKYRFMVRDANAYIEDLASLSGGRYYPAARGEDLKKYFAQIGEELRHQYVLAYYPEALEGTQKGTQQRRNIKVRVSRQKVSVRARESYIYVQPDK